MGHFSDNKLERLRISGFDEGTTNDREFAWLKDRVGWEFGDSESLADLWGLFLENAGFSGQRNDALFGWLGSLGYDVSDDLNDRLASFWGDPAPLP
ncbi:MAG: hypothetical protein HOH70_04845 [Halieaceae bacterium]|jgi:hypothetical protein|nr:hypothetical protein [Halieaceae bacterium]